MIDEFPKEDKRTQPLKGNNEKWICKKCKKPIELWGRYGFIPSCTCIELEEDLEVVGERLKQQIMFKEVKDNEKSND